MESVLIFLAFRFTKPKTLIFKDLKNRNLLFFYKTNDIIFIMIPSEGIHNSPKGPCSFLCDKVKDLLSVTVLPIFLLIGSFFASIPFSLAGRAIVCKSVLGNKDQKLLQLPEEIDPTLKNGYSVTPIEIETDGIRVTALLYSPTDVGFQKIHSTVICCPPRAIHAVDQPYREIMYEAIQQNHLSHFIVWDYGNCRNEEDLLKKGDLIVNFVNTNLLTSKNYIYGRSLGGLIAPKIKARNNGITKVVIDRSLSSLHGLIEGWLQKLDGYLSLSLRPFVAIVYWLLAKYGFDFELSKNEISNSTDFSIIYHEQDPIIPFAASSVHSYPQAQEKINLSYENRTDGNDSDPLMYHDEHLYNYEKVVQIIGRFLFSTPKKNH